MNSAPEVTALRTNVGFRTEVALRDMFTAFDPDASENTNQNNASTQIISYQIRDEGFAGGQFIVRGVDLPGDENDIAERVIPEGVFFTVTAEELNRVVYTNFEESFSERFFIRAFDGIDNSVLDQNVIFRNPTTLFNSPPIASAVTSVVPINGRLALDEMITFEDAEQNIQSILIRDNNEGGGFFTLDGSRLSANRFHEIQLDQIDDVIYVGGIRRSSETFSVQAFDGDLRSIQSTRSVFTGISRPTITAIGRPRITANQSIAATDLFRTTDADGDTIQSYFIADQNPNFRSGFWELDGVRQRAGQFFSVTAEELSTLRFIAGSPGGISDTIAVQAFDGTVYSDIETMVVRTSAPSIIRGNGEEVFAGETVLASTLFNVFDADGDLPRTYFITDRSTSAASGHFELDGNRLASASFRQLNAAQFARLRYRGGTQSGTENIGVQIFDGFEFNAISNVSVTTISQPTLTVSDGAVFPERAINVSSLVSYNDGDGDPAVRYRLLDRFSSNLTGNFVLDGNRLPTGTFFEVTPAEFSRLQYVGGTFGRLDEPILISASDGTGFGDIATFNITTLENANAPVLQTFNVNGRVGTRVNARTLFNFTDVEGDNLSTVTFTDNSARANGNFFAIDGVEQTAQQSFTVDFDLVQAGRVTYTLGTTTVPETFRINASDGTNTGRQVTGSGAGFVLPQIAPNPATGSDFSIDTIERVDVSSLVVQTDVGGPLDRYQVFDSNTGIRSGGFELNGQTLQQGVIHQLTAAEFNELVYVGAAVDNGRQLDPVLIQGGNALGFSDFIRLNLNTDQIGPDPTPSPFQFQRFRGEGPDDPLQITYTFVDGGTQAGGTPMRPNGNLPSYYRDNGEPMNNDAQVQSNGTRALNRVQREAVRSVLENLESFANIKFVEVAYDSAASEAQITYGAYRFQGDNNGPRYVEIGPELLVDNMGVTLKETNLQNGVGEERGDVWFDTEEFDPASFTAVGAGSFYRQAAFQGTLASLGVSLNASLSIFNNFQYNTIFTSGSGGINDPFPAYPGRPNTLQLYDAIAIQGQYGANPNFNSGNNHYFFNDTALQTLYDSGGIDTINFQARTAGRLGVFNDTIDLRQGQFSSINGLDRSLRISYGTVIENARGGDGNDSLTGNETKNLLFGNGGNDTIIGGGGNDVLMGGNGNDVYQWNLGDGRDLIAERSTDGNGGRDTLRITDPSNSLNSLEDDFTFRRFGNDLRIDLTLDQGPGQGTVTIKNFANAAERVELLQLIDITGNQIGNDISLNSIFQNADTTAQRFQVTSNVPVDPTDPNQGQLSLASPI